MIDCGVRDELIGDVKVSGLVADEKQDLQGLPLSQKAA